MSYHCEGHSLRIAAKSLLLFSIQLGKSWGNTRLFLFTRLSSYQNVDGP